MDVIARVALGHKESLQGNNPYLELGKAIFEAPLLSPFKIAASLFPEIKPLLVKLSAATARFRKMPFPFLIEKLRNVVDERRNNRVRLFSFNIF